MSDRESLEAASQAEPDRTFARIRNFFRLIRRPRDGESLRETIDEMIEEPSTEDPHPLSAHERVLIGNILKVHGRTAADVMVPRIDIVALHVETPFPEVVKCMVEQGHSRVPVYRETLDDEYYRSVSGHFENLLGRLSRRLADHVGLLLAGLFVAAEDGGLDGRSEIEIVSGDATRLADLQLNDLLIEAGLLEARSVIEVTSGDVTRCVYADEDHRVTGETVADRLRRLPYHLRFRVQGMVFATLFDALRGIMDISSEIKIK